MLAIRSRKLVLDANELPSSLKVSFVFLGLELTSRRKAAASYVAAGLVPVTVNRQEYVNVSGFRK